MIVSRPIAERMKSLIISRVESDDDDDDVNCGEFYGISLESRCASGYSSHVLHSYVFFSTLLPTVLDTLIANATSRPQN